MLKVQQAPDVGLQINPFSTVKYKSQDWGHKKSFFFFCLQWHQTPPETLMLLVSLSEILGIATFKLASGNIPQQSFHCRSFRIYLSVCRNFALPCLICARFLILLLEVQMDSKFIVTTFMVCFQHCRGEYCRFKHLLMSQLEACAAFWSHRIEW